MTSGFCYFARGTVEITVTYTVLFHFSLFFSCLQVPFHIKHSIFLALLLDGPALQGISPLARQSAAVSR